MLSALLVASAALTGRTLRAPVSSTALTGRTLRTQPPQRAARLAPPRCDLAQAVGALQDKVEMLQALVTKQEQIIGSLLHEQYGQGGGGKKRDPSDAPGGPSAAPDDQSDAISTLFEWIDDNGDGVLTREEYLTHFDRIDGDGDGFVTKDEFREGLWILTSSTATAAAARGEIEAAVAAERVRAIKEASRLLTEAEKHAAEPEVGTPAKMPRLDASDAPTPPTATALPPGARSASPAIPSDAASTPDLSNLPYENAIDKDYSVVLVIVTASALAAPDGGGPVLRRVLARRGVRRIYIDEAHTVSRTSMAAYNNALGQLRQTVLGLVSQLAAYGHSRPQLVGLTSTLPPNLVKEVKHSLAMTPTARTVRCNIDRPELVFQRLPLPQRRSETASTHLQRLLVFLAGHAPSWSLRGALVIFCPTAKLARAAAAILQVPLPDGAPGKRQCITYLGTGKMTPVERTEAMLHFQSDQHAILLTTEAWSHGNGRALITLILHIELCRSVVEFWQRSGRAARLAGETALVVTLAGTRPLSTRAFFTPPPDRQSASSPLTDCSKLRSLLALRGCLRASILEELGQIQCETQCGKCDECQRDLSSIHTSALSMAGLPHLFEWVCASAAAAVVLGDERLQKDGVTLSQLRSSICREAPNPFDSEEGHDLLIDALLNHGSLSAQQLPITGQPGRSFLLCHTTTAAAAMFQSGAESLTVLVPEHLVSDSAPPPGLNVPDPTRCLPPCPRHIQPGPPQLAPFVQHLHRTAVPKHDS